MTKIAKSPCLNCGYVLDMAMNVFGARGPQPGDISICIKCRHVMAFDDDVKLRALTDAEIREIAGNPRLVRTMKGLSVWRL